MTQTIDPVFSSAVLSAPELALNDLDFDALSQAMGGLKGEVDKNPQTAAIILAGGTGERFGKEGGKQLVEIAGKPILTWSAEAFDAVGDIGLIVIVCPEDRCSEYLKRAIDPFPFVTPIVVAPSGPSRQESAFSGLEFVPDDYEYVILHDGARPLISPDLWNAQTPQVFRAGIYRRAHASALSDGFMGTDDSSLIERLGGRVLVVEGKRDNIKLTVPEDYLMLAAAVRTMYMKGAEE